LTGAVQAPNAGFPGGLSHRPGGAENDGKPRLLAGRGGLCQVNPMDAAVKKLFAVMPFLFGIGFIAPLIAQVMAAWGWTAPFGMSRIGFGLILGGSWGLIANIRGRWL
jgi:hypothetical protein